MYVHILYHNYYAQAITKETAARKKSSNGLIKGHAYTITDVKEV